MRTFEQLIDDADSLANRSLAADIDNAPATAQAAIAYALIAIAQELHRMNDSRELEEEHQELEQIRKDALADPNYFSKLVSDAE